MYIGTGDKNIHLWSEKAALSSSLQWLHRSSDPIPERQCAHGNSAIVVDLMSDKEGIWSDEEDFPSSTHILSQVKNSFSFGLTHMSDEHTQ